MILFTRRLLTSAQETIVDFEGRNLDDVAKQLRLWLADSTKLPAEMLVPELGEREYLQLPAEARTTLGDRVVILVVPDSADPTERVATVCRPLRRVRRDQPLTQKPFEAVAAIIVPTAPDPEPAPAPPPAVPQVDAGGLSKGAALLRSESYRRGMKRPAVAAAVGVTADVVTQWWTGRRLPDVRQATRARDVFGIPVDAWLEPLTAGGAA